MSRKRHYLFATYADFDQAKGAVKGLKIADVEGLHTKNIELYSPIEHPEVEELLGRFHQPIQRFTFFGAITGTLCAFLLVAAVAQAMFTVQPQGGKPVIPLPMDFVVMYEGTILFGVLSTLAAFLIYSGLPKRLKKHYDPKVSEDHIGIEVEVKPEQKDKIRDILHSFGPVEIREVIQ